MSEMQCFQGYIVDVPSRCLRSVHSEKVIAFDSVQGLQIRAMMALTYKNFAELEDELRRGKVIEIMMPADASACLLLDTQGRFCFVWVTCFHGEDDEQACFPFETVEQLLLWVLSCVYSWSMTEQEALGRYCISSSAIVPLLMDPLK